MTYSEPLLTGALVLPPVLLRGNRVTAMPPEEPLGSTEAQEVEEASMMLIPPEAKVAATESELALGPSVMLLPNTLVTPRNTLSRAVEATPMLAMVPLLCLPLGAVTSLLRSVESLLRTYELITPTEKLQVLAPLRTAPV